LALTLIRLKLADELEELGFQVFEAADSQAAIDQLLRYPEIKVLFTDIDMPGDMNGLRLAAFVQNRWPPVKIIITSGKHRFGVDELPVAGIFIAKPYSCGSVAETISNVMTA
jgi:CheY-like chemotaxis protein